MRQGFGMRWVAVVVATSLVAVAALACMVLPARAAAPRQDFPPLPGGTPIVVTIPNLTPSPKAGSPGGNEPSPRPPVAKPTAKPAKKTLASRPAARVALSDRFVKALVAGKRYTVSSLVPWKNVAAGEVVTLTFARPIDVSGQWLGLGHIPYRATYRKLHGILVYVSLRQNRVQQISPKR